LCPAGKLPIVSTQLICRTLATAEKYAAELSKDPDVLATGITRFVLDEIGNRQTIALYVLGIKQQVPYVSDDRAIFSNGAKRS
jgi:hypothetical protein